MYTNSFETHQFEEFEKYQQERVDNRSPTPKFPVVPEVQLRKSNSLKPNRGNSRSNTIHIVHTNPDRTQKDILISGPLKLTWLNTGLIENIERGAVVYRNGMLEIRYDANKPKIEMKMNSMMKNNKIWEFSNPDQNIRVAVDRQHQITMGSPRERRKSVEEESPKNMNKQNLLIKLLRRRSDKQLLEKKGIFKNEDIFGNKLSVLYENSKCEVHEFVKRAVELIETDKNIKSEHIYRLSGNMATIQKIRLKIDGKNYKVLDEYKNDVDVLTGCLKLFFRELVEPLIPFKTFEELHKLTGKATGPDRDKTVKSIIKNMKTPHRENLQFLIHHLLTVESYKQYNKMTVQSLSIVWGPSMLWYPGVEKCPAYSPYEFSMLVNGVLELILMTYQADFDSNLLTLSKNDSRGVSWKDLDTISEESIKKSPSASSSSKWLFGLRKGDSKDKLTASNWSLTETKKDKPTDGYFGKPLESLPKSEMHPYIPKIIVQMAELIEKNPKIKGLYIKPATKDALGKFKKKLQKNKYDISKMDPLDAAVILPKFLQELENPLFPMRIYNEFVDNFDELDSTQKTYLVRESLENLNQERRATIEYLVLHILRVLECHDEEGKEHIQQAWLPVFSNSSIITIENDTFLKIILNIYQSKRNSTKELPSFALPLKTHFEHRFNFKNDDGMVKTTYTRISDSSISESVYSDVDPVEISSRCNSTSLASDFEVPIRDVYRSSVSVDETRRPANISGKKLKDDINNILNSRAKMNNSELMVKIYNPFNDDSKDVDNVAEDIEERTYDRPTMSTFKNVNADDSKTFHSNNTQSDIEITVTRASVEDISMDIKNNSAADNTKRDGGKPNTGSLFKTFAFNNLRRKSDRAVENIDDKSKNDVNIMDIKSNITIDHDIRKDVDKFPISTFRNNNFTSTEGSVSKDDFDNSKNYVSSNDTNKTLVDNSKRVVEKPPTSTGKKFNFSNFRRNADKAGTNVRKISPTNNISVKDINIDISENRAVGISKISIGNPVLVNTTNDIDIINARRPSIEKSMKSNSPILDNRKDADSTNIPTKRSSIEKSKINMSPISGRKDTDTVTNKTNRWPSVDKIRTAGSPVLSNTSKNDDTGIRRPSIEKIKSANSPNLGNQRKNLDISQSSTKTPSVDDNSVFANTRKIVDADTRRPSIERIKPTNSPVLGNSRKNMDVTNTPMKRPSFDNTKNNESNIPYHNISGDTVSFDSKKDNNKPELTSKGITRENFNANKEKVSLGIKSNLNKIMAGQTLENARARAEMVTQRKT